MRRAAFLLLVARVALADGVARYNDPLPPRARPPLAARLGDLVRQVAAANGRPSPEWDARLEAALTELIRFLPASGPPPNELVQSALHLQGIVEPSPHLVVVSGGAGRDDALLAELQAKLPSVLEQGRYRRMGVAIFAPSPEAPSRILIGLQETFLALQPVSRQLPRAGSAFLDGKLLPPYAKPELFVTGPDGAVGRVEVAALGDGRFRAPFRCGALDGRYQLEIVGEDRFGLAVLANFPIYCGAAAPSRLQAPVEPPARPWADAADAEAQVLALVNEDRARAGLRPLALDPALSTVARAHSADMRDHHFFGHVSPSTGNADDRLKHAGIQVPLVLENVGRAYSPVEAERGLMDSPGHRGNILNPRVERAGIGVAVAQSSPGGVRDLFVTQLFVRLAEPYRADRAPEELRTRVDALRRDKGLAPLADDAELDAVAREVADGIARGALPPDHAGAPVEKALARLARYQSLRTVVARASEVAQIGGSQALLDGTATHAGCAVALGPTDAEGRPLILVVVLGARR